MMRFVFAFLLLLAACGDDGESPHPPPQSSAVEVSETATTVTIHSPVAGLEIDKASVGFRLLSSTGSVLTQSAEAPALVSDSEHQLLERVLSTQLIHRGGEVRGVELTCATGNSTAQLNVELLSSRSVAMRLRPATAADFTRVTTTLHAAANEHFYGLMERSVDAPSGGVNDRRPSEIIPQEVGGLDRRGTTVTMIVNPTLSLYTPFFHSSRGYGVFVEGTMPGRYDLAKTAADAVVMDFELNQRTGEHGVVYFVGDHDTILDEYTALTGRPFVPPIWGFKHWRWRDEHAPGPPAVLDGVDMNAQLVEDVTMYEQLGIPVGSYEFDRPWTSGSTNRGQGGFASFSFDSERFPNSAAMLSALQRRGYHIFVFGAPWALGDNAADAERFGYYAPRNNILIDYTNPAAVTWWQARVQTLIDLGIRGIKLDRAELQPTVTELPDMPDKATDIWFDGRNGREMKNAYAPLFAKVHYDAFHARLGDDFLHYFRAGYAGSQQYGVFWGGDITGKDQFGLGASTDLGLRSAILALNHVAFMGFPIWGTDTGGYYEFGDREVFARWLELSAVCPIMEIGGSGAHAPWSMPTEPHYDTEMIDIYRRYVTLHHELVPLLYSLGIEAHASGRPLARPLLFDFADDANVADLWDQFVLGRDLLVAPLWKSGARSREVYFPRGTWIDWNDPHRRIVGPTRTTVDAGLDQLPVFVRAGGIVPLDVASSVTGNGSAASAGRLTIDAYPSGTSSFTLHAVDGDTTFTLSDNDCGASPCVRLAISASRRGYIVRLLTAAPGRVSFDGQDLEQLDSFAAWEAAQSGWFYDNTSRRLLAKLSSAGQGLELRVAAE
jgi:alpha-glucosidase (family GH31 glycosyl hydrolase)